jgi:hypothetical protein
LSWCSWCSSIFTVATTKINSLTNNRGNGVHFCDEVETIGPKDYGGTVVLNNFVRVCHNGNKHITQQNHDQESITNVKNLSNDDLIVTGLSSNFTLRYEV